MTAAELDQSARNDPAPPEDLPTTLLALWMVRAGRWHDSHDLTNDIPDPDGAWIHAHLHREEGDLGNASYWYHRARREMPPQSVSLDEEWWQLAQHFSDQ